MSRKDRQRTARESKERRQKQIAVAGAVLLAIILAYELPKVMGGGNSATPPAATSTTAASGSSTVSAGTSPGVAAAATSAPTARTRLPNSDVAPRRTKSQLASFSQFASKDPFDQQVKPQVTASTPGSTTSSGSSPSAPASGSAGGASSPSVGAQLTASRTLAQNQVATISVNGKRETVHIGSSFPSSNPIFKLVSLANGAAMIGIANGSYASGAQTVSLTAGQPLTLVDTADGARYQLRLLASS